MTDRPQGHGWWQEVYDGESAYVPADDQTVQLGQVTVLGYDDNQPSGSQDTWLLDDNTLAWGQVGDLSHGAQITVTKTQSLPGVGPTDNGQGLGLGDSRRRGRLGRHTSQTDRGSDGQRLAKKAVSDYFPEYLGSISTYLHECGHLGTAGSCHPVWLRPNPADLWGTDSAGAGTGTARPIRA